MRIVVLVLFLISCSLTQNKIEFSWHHIIPENCTFVKNIQVDGRGKKSAKIRQLLSAEARKVGGNYVAVYFIDDGDDNIIFKATAQKCNN